MLAALENGVKGGKWFSLIDKVYRAETLKAAWIALCVDGCGRYFETGEATGNGSLSRGSSALAQYIVRGPGTVHHDCSLEASEPIPMRKLPTGEPCAGEPHSRFGGRGRRTPFPTSIAWGALIYSSNFWARTPVRLAIVDCSDAVWPFRGIWKRGLREHSKKEGVTIHCDWEGKMSSDYKPM